MNRNIRYTTDNSSFYNEDRASWRLPWNDPLLGDRAKTLYSVFLFRTADICSSFRFERRGKANVSKWWFCSLCKCKTDTLRPISICAGVDATLVGSCWWTGLDSVDRKILSALDFSKRPLPLYRFGLGLSFRFFVWNCYTRQIWKKGFMFYVL